MCSKSLSFRGISFLIILIFKPGLSSEIPQQSLEEDGNDDDRHFSSEIYGGIEKKYELHWNAVPMKDAYSIIDDPVDCITNKTCNVDVDCFICFPNMEDAFREGMPTDIPHEPYCLNKTTPMNNTNETGQCRCEYGFCVSYSRNHVTGALFFYCGPCGYVGSSCGEEQRCTNQMGECRSGYCECIEDGTFYDMSFCYLPYYGTKMMIEMFVSTIIIVALCGILAYSYHRLSSSRRRYFRRFGSRRRNSVVRESPASDTPPTYDDVVEKVPSYQDALEMENSNAKGLSNPAFVDDEEGLPPSYEESALEIQTQRASSSSSTLEGMDGASATSEEQPIRNENVTLPGENSLVTKQSKASETSETEHQPIELPLQDALETYRTQDHTGHQD